MVRDKKIMACKGEGSGHTWQGDDGSSRAGVWRRGGKWLGAILVTVATVVLSPGAPAGSVLDEVKSRGKLRCGVSEGIPGFSIESNGRWQGLDADYCRALAVAVLGDPEAVEFTPLGADARFEALREGSIDVLSRNSTWTLAREVDFGIAFVGILFFDGQGFLARRDSSARFALELDGASICVKPNTTSEHNLANYFAVNGMKFKLVPAEDFDAMRASFESGACEVATSDQSQLHALRVALEDPNSAKVLPEFISKEPLSPAVAVGDPQWVLIGRLVLAVLINADELGISSRNVDQIASVAASAQVRGLLDLDDRFAKQLGLASGWARKLLSTVGNYGELFERNLGANTPLKLKRGQNAPWNQGGLLYAPRIE